MFVRFMLLAFLIGGCGPSPEEVPALIDGLRSSEASVRNDCALKLARVGAPHAERAVPILIGLLYDENRGVQSAAAYALRRIDTPEARAALHQTRRKFNE